MDLGQIYDEHAQALYGFLLNLTRNEAETYDLLQEVFLKLARHPDALAGIQDSKSFLMKWARNAFLDRVRHRNVVDRHQEEHRLEGEKFFEGANPAEEMEFRMALGEALMTLPMEQREVVYLKLWEEWTFDEIARFLDLPANTAASRYRYGMEKLRERLRPLYEEIR